MCDGIIEPLDGDQGGRDQQKELGPPGPVEIKMMRRDVLPERGGGMRRREIVWNMGLGSLHGFLSRQEGGSYSNGSFDAGKTIVDRDMKSAR